MDPVTLTLAIGATAAAASSAAGGMQAAQQASAQSKAAKYNANELHQQGLLDTDIATSNENQSINKSAMALGEQGAAFGQANTGTGGSAGQVERQSATMSRADALNIWYGGELERHQADAASADQLYQSKVYSSNAKSALFQGAMGAGTALLTGAAKKYGGYGGFSPFDQNQMDGLF